MARAFNRRQKVTLLIASFVAVASLALIAWMCVSSGTQGRNMAKATKHIAVIEPALHADTRFQNVQLLSYTSNNGCLLVEGYVASEIALNDLRRIIEKSRPPVFTKYTVIVLPNEPDRK